MFTEDLSEFFDQAHGFAVVATIGAASVNGVFDDAYFGVDTNGIEVAGSQPRFLCAVASLPTITLGTTTAVINSTTYTIVETQPDGTGLTALILRE